VAVVIFTIELSTDISEPEKKVQVEKKLRTKVGRTVGV
jgi:hypothetical protein